MAEMEDRWLSVDEIDNYLDASNDTVYRWIAICYARPSHGPSFGGSRKTKSMSGRRQAARRKAIKRKLAVENHRQHQFFAWR
jgi:hypothetical protein